ncbi:hypothetical protein TIFTF001_012177 [Ficus carica]|uniref:Uncharacterized protein n=1 Tax=Ficus carica TaxID=3494 RepID=A0AA87ZYJ4_FICCA|nr:hypothetical protein TIFTF001_012177 [Ficus carica]
MESGDDSGRNWAPQRPSQSRRRRQRGCESWRRGRFEIDCELQWPRRLQSLAKNREIAISRTAPSTGVPRLGGDGGPARLGWVRYIVGFFG